MQTSHRIELPVDIGEAWRRITAWEDQAQWMKDADWVRVVGDQREGVGTTIAVKTRLFNIPAFVDPMEVLAWEPPTLLRIRHGSLVTGIGTWGLEPAGDRGELTEFSWTEDVTLNVPVVGELAARIYARFLSRLMRASMADLRTFLAGAG